MSLRQRVIEAGHMEPVNQGRLRGNMTQNDRGEWVPAIPYALTRPFGAKRRHLCQYCGEVRWSELSYREHYALAHVMGMSS